MLRPVSEAGVSIKRLPSALPLRERYVVPARNRIFDFPVSSLLFRLLDRVRLSLPFKFLCPCSRGTVKGSFPFFLDPRDERDREIPFFSSFCSLHGVQLFPLFFFSARHVLLNPFPLRVNILSESLRVSLPARRSSRGLFFCSPFFLLSFLAGRRSTANFSEPEVLCPPFFLTARTIQGSSFFFFLLSI